MAARRAWRAWAGLAAGLLASLLLACASPAVATDDDLADLSREVAAAVDAARVERGLEPLAWNDTAARLARDHSAAMAKGRSGFGHKGFEDRAKQLAKELPQRFPPILDAEGKFAPADVEFGFVAGELRLYQLRPFLESRQARRSQYLQSLYRHSDCEA